MQFWVQVTGPHPIRAGKTRNGSSPQIPDPAQFRGLGKREEFLSHGATWARCRELGPAALVLGLHCDVLGMHTI